MRAQANTRVQKDVPHASMPSCSKRPQRCTLHPCAPSRQNCLTCVRNPVRFLGSLFTCFASLCQQYFVLDATHPGPMLDCIDVCRREVPTTTVRRNSVRPFCCAGPPIVRPMTGSHVVLIRDEASGTSRKYELRPGKDHAMLHVTCNGRATQFPTWFVPA